MLFSSFWGFVGSIPFEKLVFSYIFYTFASSKQIIYVYEEEQIHFEWKFE